MALGLNGQEVGQMLKNLFNRVLDDPKINTKDDLTKLVKYL
jgi:hypothetical protein